MITDLQTPTQALPDLFDATSAIRPGATRDCFHLPVSSGEYHSLPDSVSCSGLKHLLRSPAHFQAYLQQPFDDKPNIGTALHCAILEPEVFAKTYTFYKGDRRGKAFTEFEANNPGKLVLSEKEWLSVGGMAKSVMAYDEFPLWQALQGSEREFSVFWTDEETGVQCRVRFDALFPLFAIFAELPAPRNLQTLHLKPFLPASAIRSLLFRTNALARHPLKEADR